jgi:hypothetical protein
MATTMPLEDDNLFWSDQKIRVPTQKRHGEGKAVGLGIVRRLCCEKQLRILVVFARTHAHDRATPCLQQWLPASS